MTRRAVRLNLTAAIVALAAGIAIAQQPQAAKSLQFEVASIKPGGPNHLGSEISTGRGFYKMVNVPLKQWVEMALFVPEYELKAPGWLDTTNFDLEARLPSGPVDQKAMGEMMKSLMTERFGLKWHEEPSTVSGYVLLPDKKVLVQPVPPTERRGGSSSGPFMINGKNISMSKLAELLGNTLKRPVLDATHLSGEYDIKLMWRPENEAAVAQLRQNGKQYGIEVDSLPDSVFTAVREQLGLRLQSAKVPAKVIVIDQINRQPTAN